MLEGVKGKLALAIIVALVGAAVLSIAAVTAGQFLVKMRVDVPGAELSPDIIEIPLDIDKPQGREVLAEVAVLRVYGEGVAVEFKTLEPEVRGSVSLIAGATVTLEGDEGSTVIHMPCILDINVGCIRPLAIIPGYDAPLPLNPGEYKVSIEITWSSASGKGEVNLPITIEYIVEERQP
ncbi:hypothetical protein apy_16700 [Aeropyrum pernix]|uniref:Uncharacterized protein n=1 Tax=Aeropyrum pernix TaxID=56636 RepID=A0A401HBX3_AERPX|nr:hypothetical protein [Aeropyrum pernix]GBF09945.1 hypothetical protein apy_16700 [Aeropyrum pernix]